MNKLLLFLFSMTFLNLGFADQGQPEKKSSGDVTEEAVKADDPDDDKADDPDDDKADDPDDDKAVE